MGRRPNAIIQEFFERGQKLKDQSNRYPQTCKLCREEFPKGRQDALITHLTKRCTMITHTQRINACLALNGINARAPRSVQARQQQQQQQEQHGQQQFPQHHAQLPLDLSQLQSQQNWTLTPLETLAEVSRQQITHLNEHRQDGSQSHQHLITDAELMSGIVTSAGSGHDEFTLDSPRSVPRNGQAEKQDQPDAQSGRGRLSSWDMAMHDLTPLTGALESDNQGNGEERSQNSEGLAVVSNEAPNLTMAAAAAARLSNATMLDPTLFNEDNLASNIATNDADLGDHAHAIDSDELPQPDATTPAHATPSPITHVAVPTPSAKLDRSTPRLHSPSPMSPSDAARLANAEPTQFAPDTDDTTHVPQVPEHHTPPRPNAPSGSTQQLPWGQFTYMTTATTPAQPTQMQPMMGLPTRSVFRLDQNGNKGRHSRARFSEPRRKEVQNIRRIGACIRCRILRKTCSQGDPCDTCRKVLTPRIWNTGCIRTKFTDKLDLYGARIQAHHCTRAVEEIQRTKDTKHPVVVLEATHSNEGVTLVFEALRAVNQGEQVDPTRSHEYQTVFPKIVMADPQADLPEAMQVYLDQILPELIHKEEAAFSRVTLEMALEQATITGNKILKLALDLWGLVEIIERELKWKYAVQVSPVTREKARSITKETDPELYKTLGFQLSATAEMKAEITSKQLLLHMGRDLQDGRVVIDKPMFCAIMLLLISVEKSTWAFLTWERVPQLKEQWPLSTQPGEFTGQGDQLAELLRMLLTIRKALPKTTVRDEDDVLTTDEPDYQTYFEQINLKASDVVQRRLHPPFYATTSRSLELRYCSTILLPEHLLPPQEGAPAPVQESEVAAMTTQANEANSHHEVAYDGAQSGVVAADGATDAH